MSKIYELLLIGSVTIGLYVSFVLIFISKHNRLLNKLLATFSLTMSLFYFLVFCIKRNWAPDFTILMRTFLPLYYFLPASCYLYFRTFIQDDTRLTKKDLINLLPITLHFIYITPLIFSIASGEIQWKQIVDNVNEQTYFYNYGPIPDKYHVIFKLAVMLFYTFLIWKNYLGKKFQDYIAKNQSVYPFSIRWIKYYVIVITANAIFSVLMKSEIFFLHTKSGMLYGDFISMGLLFSFDLLVAYAIFKPVVLFGLPHFTNIIEVKNTESQSEDNSAKNTGIEQRLSDSSFDSNFVEESILTVPQETASDTVIDENELKKMQLLIEQMNNYINNHQPFRESDFNIASLSHSLNVPQHHLAYVFRHVINKSFTDFRSELRVNYVKEILKNGMPKELTIESVGTDAGFTSRATFFAVFKKVTGMTPTQFLKNK